MQECRVYIERVSGMETGIITGPGELNAGAVVVPTAGTDTWSQT